ncbi:RecD-like DNA helicase YrrC [Acetivibrio straminisolvens JCM 21531]|uniref:RecD-like DNA helicase YrrC n=1 Tax=Acetivibrio straminisolvens JCM 21531 TaxID=1294263 RepID=W4V2R3_9FIRM|nr:RecD-like DNA helicase YrrC [Acetivibrio straminisolvens JCM 21531]
MVTIEGTIEEIIFSNEANGYTVCEIKSDKDVITAVATCLLLMWVKR